MIVLGQKWLYSVKVAVFDEIGRLRANWLYSGKSGCIRAKIVVFKQMLAVFGQK